MPYFTSVAATIIDKEEKQGIVSAFRSAVKCYHYFYHVVFLECCKHVDTRPHGIQIKKESFTKFESEDTTAFWEQTIVSTERDLFETLVFGVVEKMVNFEITFWEQLAEIEEDVTNIDDILEWCVKLVRYLEKKEEKIRQRKKKKLRKLLNSDKDKMAMALQRFDEHLSCFEFKNQLSQHGQILFPDIENLLNLIEISSSSQSTSSDIPTPSKFSSDSIEPKCDFSSIAKDKGDRLQGVYVSDNVLNLSKREFTEAEASLLSKGLKFVPTPRYVDQAALKQDLERFGRKLRLKWFFRDDERDFVSNPFKKASKFNPKNQDTAIELYLSRLEEEILKINTNIKYQNVTKEERRALDSLRNDTSIIIKEADKGSCVVIWDRNDYLKEAEVQLGDENVYEHLSGDAVSPLIKTVKTCLAKIDNRGDISREILDYFLVNNPKLGRFYLLPKIHKRLFNVPGRPVISNSSFFTENISAFLDFQLKPLAKQVKSFIKDTNDFLKKLSNLPKLSDNVKYCAQWTW